MGFGVLIKRWLRDWAEALPNQKCLHEGGILAPAPMRKMWREPVSGQRRWYCHSRGILMPEAWFELEYSV